MIQCLCRSWSLFSLALLTAAPLASQLIPLGPAFQINTAGLQGGSGTELALDGSGTLLTAWSGASSEELLVRTFSRSGEPLGPVASLSTPGRCAISPVATALGPGRFLAAWNNSECFPPRTGDASGTLGAPWTLSGRFVGKDGAPLGPEIRLDSTDPAMLRSSSVQLAPLPAGGFLATWGVYGSGCNTADRSCLAARAFDENGVPAGAETLVSAGAVGSNNSVGPLPDGGFVAVWYNSRPIHLFPGTWPADHLLRQRRFDAVRQPATPVMDLEPGEAAIASDGHAVVAWSAEELGFHAYVRLYDPDGHPLTGPILVGGLEYEVVEAVALDEAGRFLVVWSSSDDGEDFDLFARLFSAGGEPLGPSFTVASGPGRQAGARVAEKNGDWVISWASVPPYPYGPTDLFARRFTTCAPEGSLCLGGRFRAEVAWKVPGTGQTGAGQAIPLTGDTGAFWFFSPENVELVAKAIDGRSLNDHFWIFYGALSNVAYDLTVTDTVTGEKKVYHNPAGTMASRADTRAFQDPGPPPPSKVVSLDAPESTAADPLTCPPGIGFCCPPLPGVPCLHGGRFSVDVTWRIPGTGQNGSGQAVGLTSDSAYVWFFNSNNVELVIKILDGSAVNGKYWVFYGALSDVEYTIRVTDHLTGKVKTYHNPAGTMASRADTSAF